MSGLCIPREQLSEFLAGTLDETVESQVTEHLRDCLPCGRAVDQLTDEAFGGEALSCRILPRATADTNPCLAELKTRLKALARTESGSSQPLDTVGGSHERAADELSEDVVPPRLGKFELVRCVGQGGFGIVYLARDAVLNRELALKLPRGRLLADPDARRRFYREAKALARLNHPHVVPVYEAGEHDGTCYLAMGYCDGPTLDEWRVAQGGTAPPRIAAQIVFALANAAAHAHAQGILHRDIKPANVLLDRSAPDAWLPTVRCRSIRS